MVAGEGAADAASKSAVPEEMGERGGKDVVGGDEALGEALPEALGGDAVFFSKAKEFEVVVVADESVGAGSDGAKAGGGHFLLSVELGPVFFGEGANGFDEQVANGEVGEGALLYVDEAYFNGAAAVDEDGVQGIGSMGKFESPADGIVDPLLIVGLSKDGFGNTKAGDDGNSLLVFQIIVETIVGKGTKFVFVERRAGGETGNEGKDEANGGVETAEFVVAGEG